MGETSTIIIGPMEKDDLEQVLAIENVAFTMPWSRTLFLSEFRNRNISLMMVSREASPERSIIAYTVCWVIVDEVHILDLATRPDRLRQGIGRQLAVAALVEAHKRGARQAFLEVRESNIAARMLYLGMGFTQTMVRKEYYDQPVEDALIMSLDTAMYRKLIDQG